MITIITNNKSKTFTTKTKAALYLGVSTMTLYRAIRKMKHLSKNTFIYHSKKKNRQFDVYFDAELVRKNDEL